VTQKAGDFYYWSVLRDMAKGVPKKALCNPKFVFSFFIIMSISSAGVWAPWAFEIDLSSVCNTTIGTTKETSSVKTYTENNTLELGSAFVGWGDVKTEPPSPDTQNPQRAVSLSLTESLKQSCAHISSLPIILFQGFAIFMFNLGLLGGIAFEFFVGQGPKKYEQLDFDELKINKMRTNEFAGFFAWLVAFVLSFYGLKEPTTTSILSILGSFIAISLWICTNYNKTEFKQSPPKPSNIEAGGDGVGNETELTGAGLQ